MNESPLLVFPTTEANWLNENVRTEGMTLRDYFAAMAMQSTTLAFPPSNQKLVASAAYSMADAMLKARSISNATGE